MRSAELPHWLARLDADHDNLRAALRHAIAVGDVETALSLIWHAARYWGTRGHVAEGRELAEAALAAGGGPPELRMHVEQRRRRPGRRAGRLRRRPRALRDRAGARARRSAPPADRGHGDQPGDAGDVRGRLRDRVARYEEATVVARELGDERQLSLALQNLGIAHEGAGHREPRDRRARGEPRARPARAPIPAISRPRSARSPACCSTRTRRARSALLHESLELARDLGDRNAIVEALETAGRRDRPRAHRRAADGAPPARCAPRRGAIRQPDEEAWFARAEAALRDDARRRRASTPRVAEGAALGRRRGRRLARCAIGRLIWPRDGLRDPRSAAGRRPGRRDRGPGAQAARAAGDAAARLSRRRRLGQPPDRRAVGRGPAAHRRQGAAGARVAAAARCSARRTRSSPAPTGYAIDLEPGPLDLERFETLVARAARRAAAAGRPSCCARRWRCSADRRSPTRRCYGPAAGEADRLTELRLAALERRIELDLAARPRRASWSASSSADRRAPVPRAPPRAADARAVPLRPPGRRARGLPPRAARARRGPRARAQPRAAASRGGRSSARTRRSTPPRPRLRRRPRPAAPAPAAARAGDAAARPRRGPRDGHGAARATPTSGCSR